MKIKYLVLALLPLSLMACQTVQNVTDNVISQINTNAAKNLTEYTWTYQGSKRVVDVYGLWRFSPATALRVTVSNLTPRDYLTGSTYIGNGFSETSNTNTRNWQNVQVRLEMKI